MWRLVINNRSSFGHVRVFTIDRPSVHQARREYSGAKTAEIFPVIK